MWGGKRGDRMKDAKIGMRGFNKCVSSVTDQQTYRPTNQRTNGLVSSFGYPLPVEMKHFFKLRKMYIAMLSRGR